MIAAPVASVPAFFPPFQEPAPHTFGWRSRGRLAFRGTARVSIGRSYLSVGALYEDGDDEEVLFFL